MGKTRDPAQQFQMNLHSLYSISAGRDHKTIIERQKWFTLIDQLPNLAESIKHIQWDREKMAAKMQLIGEALERLLTRDKNTFDLEFSSISNDIQDELKAMNQEPRKPFTLQSPFTQLTTAHYQL